MIKFFMILPVLFLFLNSLYPEVLLNKDIIGIIDQSVFEVMVLKPTNDTLTYEKPLPNNLIPFNERKDAYYSIGTAFAISETEFVSAAHVFNMQYESQFADLFLRDKAGSIYSVDKITGYSNDKDYILFTIKDKKVKRFLTQKTNFIMNDEVFAVGNALGEGIVIRNGLLTSTTPEEEEGKWNFLRFSAAASPGNSGGPLLDKDGSVIGIVLRKSENENLNYALPVAEVLNSSKTQGIFHQRLRYLIPNMTQNQMTNIDFQVSLPGDYTQLKSNIISQFQTGVKQTLNQFLLENSNIIFPRGKGSAELLCDNYPEALPSIISEDDTGRWYSVEPSKNQTADLDDNGYIHYGSTMQSLFIYFKRPNNIPLASIYTNSQLFMEELLKGIPLYRYVMSEKIKIVSMGKAVEERIYTDHYHRKWLVKTWLMDYTDSKIITYSLPTPEGVITMMRINQTGIANLSDYLDLEMLTDFINCSYYGTFENWHEFLAFKDYVPDVFKQMDFSYQFGKFASIKTGRLSIHYTSKDQDITKDSDLKITLSYYSDKGNVVWDMAGVTFGENKDTYDYFSVYRKMRPSEELKDSIQSEWKKMLMHKYPYNASLINEDDKKYIKQVHPAFLKVKQTDSNDFVYVVVVGRENSNSEKELQKGIKNFSSLIKITE